MRRLLVGFLVGMLAVAAAASCRQSVDLPYEVSPTPSPSGTATPTPTPGPEPFGSGRDGDATFTTQTFVNACVGIAAASGTAVEAGGSAAAFTSGQRVLVMQVNDDFATLGDPADLASTGDAGRWELARVASVSGSSITLEAGLTRSYDSDLSRRAQVCTVPEYRNLTITASGQIHSNAWDGTRNGIVALLVSTSLTLDGEILAFGDGFPGGQASDSGANGDVIADVTTSDEGGGKGWSLDGRARDTFGRGNLGNGGGGGNAHNSGGGGGGNGGAGGFGGQQGESPTVNVNTRGKPGSAIAMDAASCLSFGGGGGGGHHDGENFGVGGNGGGAILILARKVGGNGTIAASGGNGGTDPMGASRDGAGGGGAGGTIVVISDDMTSYSGVVRANGGDGGDCGCSPTDDDKNCGPGGGGGGGRILVPASTAVPNVFTRPGLAGEIFVDGVATGDPWGATDGATGVIQQAP